MSISVDVTVQEGRIPLSRACVVRIATAVLRAEHVRDAELSITFIPRRAIAALNRKHLGHRGATDVISFELGQGGIGTTAVGDIYIAPDVARVNAREHGIPVTEELARLVVHGTLHVLGYSHPEGPRSNRTASSMWQRQERLLRRALASDARTGPREVARA